jgi:hypothetical protein
MTIIKLRKEKRKKNILEIQKNYKNLNNYIIKIIKIKKFVYKYKNKIFTKTITNYIQRIIKN